MAKLKESTKSSNNTSGVQSTNNKTIGWTSLPWRNLPTIIVSMPQLRFPHSLQTTVSTLVSTFPFLRFLSIRWPDACLKLQDVHRDLSLELRVVGEQYKDHVDRHRLVVPPFAVDVMVWLQCPHIATICPYVKLDYKKLDPFHIIEQINPVAFRLALPQTFKIHNVFHVSLLELFHPSRILGPYPIRQRRRPDSRKPFV